MLGCFQMMDSPADESKFEKIFFHYRGYAYQVAFNMLQNIEDAEDVVQSSFMIISQNLRKLEEPISLKTQGFIATVVKNQARDLLRFRAAHTNVEFNDQIMLVGWNPELVESNENMNSHLNKLPSNYKNVVVFKTLYGLTNWEVAKALKLSYSNVIKIDQRAKKKLRESYKEEGRS